MTIASFFAGVGGLELGLEWAGLGPTVFQCESDPYARSVLERHWPGVPRHDDITRLDPADIPDADVWCGGFPCQDISVAGKGAGLDGARSGLWWTWYELIRVVRPRVLVLENVAALASRGLDAVLGAISALGYDAEWHRLSAADVGAPHLRRRIFVIAYLRDSDGSDEEAIPRAREGATTDTGGGGLPDPLGDPLRDEPGRIFVIAHLADAGGGRLCESADGQGEQSRRTEAVRPSADAPDTLGDPLRDEPGRVCGARGAADEAQPGHDGSEGALADADGRHEPHQREGENGQADERAEQGGGELRARGRGQDVSDAPGDGLEKRPRKDGQPKRGCLTQSRMDALREGADVPDADSRGQQGERGGRLLDGERAALRNDAHGRDRARPMGSPIGAGLEERQGEPGDPRAQLPPALRTGGASPSGRIPQSGLGLPPDGLPGWLAGWEDGIPRVASGVHDRVAQLRCLGNAVVPQCAYVVGMRVREILTSPAAPPPGSPR